MTSPRTVRPARLATEKTRQCEYQDGTSPIPLDPPTRPRQLTVAPAKDPNQRHARHGPGDPARRHDRGFFADYVAFVLL